MAIVLTGIEPSTYEHPYDRDALEKVKKIPLLPSITEWFLQNTQVRFDIVKLQGRDFHVTRKSCPNLYETLSTAAKRLGVIMPPIYTTQAYGINAYTMGHQNNAHIVLFSGAVDRLSPEELTFVVGHELGHIKSGHVLYQSMVEYMTDIVNRFPLLSQGAKVALFGWSRMSEFTADRAGLLACQNIDVALSMLMKMSGLPLSHYNEANLDGYKEQIETFRRTNAGIIDNTFQKLYNMIQSHPWNILRASMLIDWYGSGEYKKIIDGVVNSTKVCSVCGTRISDGCTTCPRCGYKWG